MVRESRCAHHVSGGQYQSACLSRSLPESHRGFRRGGRGHTPLHWAILQRCLRSWCPEQWIHRQRFPDRYLLQEPVFRRTDQRLTALHLHRGITRARNRGLGQLCTERICPYLQSRNQRHQLLPPEHHAPVLAWRSNQRSLWQKGLHAIHSDSYGYLSRLLLPHQVQGNDLRERDTGPNVRHQYQQPLHLGRLWSRVCLGLHGSSGMGLHQSECPEFQGYPHALGICREVDRRAA